MKKSVCLGICLSILLTACSSGDKTDKNKQDFRPNSKVEVIPAAQMALAQQKQDFPESKANPAFQQYAEATNTTAMVPVDLPDGDSGTSLPAMTEPNAPIQPVSIPTTSFVQPISLPSSAPAPVPVPVPAPNTNSTTNSSVADGKMQSSATQNTQTPIQAPIQATSPVTNNNRTPTNDLPVGWSTKQNPSPSQNPAPATTATAQVTQTSAPVQPVIERYEALRQTKPSTPKVVTQQAQTSVQAPSSSAYANFDNVATPVTFTNSPYNMQLNSFNGSSQESSAPAPTHPSKNATAESATPVSMPASASPNEN
ncbi:MAG: hypothetical protein HKM04_11505 [Legionellales bacterium]|nr:hypothetical protein [Legionellales bacterium]